MVYVLFVALIVLMVSLVAYQRKGQIYDPGEVKKIPGAIGHALVSLIGSFIFAVAYFYAATYLCFDFLWNIPFMRAKLGPGGAAGLAPFMFFLLLSAIAFILSSYVFMQRDKHRWLILGGYFVSTIIITSTLVALGVFYAVSGIG